MFVIDTENRAIQTVWDNKQLSSLLDNYREKSLEFSLGQKQVYCYNKNPSIKWHMKEASYFSFRAQNGYVTSMYQTPRDPLRNGYHTHHVSPIPGSHMVGGAVLWFGHSFSLSPKAHVLEAGSPMCQHKWWRKQLSVSLGPEPRAADVLGKVL